MPIPSTQVNTFEQLYSLQNVAYVGSSGSDVCANRYKSVRFGHMIYARVPNMKEFEQKLITHYKYNTVQCAPTTTGERRLTNIAMMSSQSITEGWVYAIVLPYEKITQKTPWCVILGCIIF